MPVVDVGTLSLLEQPGLEADETSLELATVEDGDTSSTLIIIGALEQSTVFSTSGVCSDSVTSSCRSQTRKPSDCSESITSPCCSMRSQGLGDVSFSTEIAGLEVLLLLK